MNKYHIRIDGIESQGSFTYQELVDMGLFLLPERGLNGIEVKKTTNKVFKPLKQFYFPESLSNEDSYSVDEYGQIHRKEKKKKKQEGAYVDEYGQIVRPNAQRSRSSSTTTRSAYTNSSTSSNVSSNNSSNSNDDGITGKVCVTLIVLAIVIPIVVDMLDTEWCILPIFVAYLVLKWIWGWDD